MPFEDSRRLTGSNLFFATTGAVLDCVATPLDDALLAAWRGRVEKVGAQLGWTHGQAVVRRHASGVLLAIAAPWDQLLLATEVNEWALCAALAERDPSRWRNLQDALIAAAREAGDSPGTEAGLEPLLDEAAAFARFARLARVQANPAVRELLEAAATKALPYFLDAGTLTLGAGAASRSFSLDGVPSVAQVDWSTLADIPTAVVTGSNGKTTTVRLIAACTRAHGWRTGYNCTDGVFIDKETVASGDYSGPDGARMVMRDARVQAAILETARGGILRRGLAVTRVGAAVVTNISSDHFGEYGIDDLPGLARVKLTVAAVVAAGGLLILNADDPELRRGADGLVQRFGSRPALGWFASDADQTFLRDYRLQGAQSCGVRHGRLILDTLREAQDLGPVAAMPMSIGGKASYNIANLAAAALAASALGVPARVIGSVFASFGAYPDDNPGRLMRFTFNGAHVIIDYAHNPDGLRQLLTLANQLRGAEGRLGLLLGHAGNRKNADIEAVARTAAEFHPQLIVVKENEQQLRGRDPGEVPHIIRAELLRQGLPPSVLPIRDTEIEAARFALAWARPGDVLALPLHSAAARLSAIHLLETQVPASANDL